MEDGPITIRLTADECALLEEAVPKEKALAAAFVFHLSRDNASIQVLPRNVEQIRDFLTLELAETGFKEDYGPKDRGLLIESLIDKLFIS
jgi:hypothetical protein